MEVIYFDVCFDCAVYGYVEQDEEHSNSKSSSPTSPTSTETKYRTNVGGMKPELLAECLVVELKSREREEGGYVDTYIYISTYRSTCIKSRASCCMHHALKERSV